jgi:hypothetical protein
MRNHALTDAEPKIIDEEQESCLQVPDLEFIFPVTSAAAAVPDVESRHICRTELLDRTQMPD